MSKEHFDDFNIVSVNDGEYCGVCQRCKGRFIGAKRQLYCSYCGQIVELEKENAELKENYKKVLLENADLLTIFQGMYTNIGVVLKNYKSAK